MKTPAGKECPQYYADFHRGRHIQECRLAQRNSESAPWHPNDCAKCPIPDIVRANASPNMRLRLTIKPGILGIGRSLRVDAYCEKHAIPIDDPFVGCLQCNAERPGIDAFLDALGNPRMIKAVLLDLDDTLLHTHTDHFVRRYLEQLAQSITEQYSRLTNAETTPGQALRLAARETSTSADPLRTNGEVFLGTIADLLHIPMAELVALFEAFHRGFYQELGNDVEVIPAAAPLLDRLIDMGMTVVIATNPFFAPEAVMQRLAWGGLDRPRLPYALITHIENMHFVKPSPHYYEEILARVGAEADEAIMIGDSMDNDIIPALKAGLHTFWIDQGMPPTETPDGSGTLEDFARLVANGWLTTLKPRRRTADQVVPRLLGDTAALFGLISEMIPAYWHKRPDPNEWSPLETVCHLRDSERNVQRPRLERIARENNPFISETPAPPGPGARDLAGEDGSAALREFWQERCLTLDFIQGLSTADWALPARHSIFGPTTLLEMAHFTTRHDHLHISQLCETIGRCRAS